MVDQNKNDKIAFINWVKSLCNEDLFYETFEQFEISYTPDGLWKFKRETIKTEFENRLKKCGWMR